MMFAGQNLISVFDLRSKVARYVNGDQPGTLVVQYADNWEALEADAAAAVVAAGGAINMSGLYVCPEELAQRAVYPDA